MATKQVEVAFVHHLSQHDIKLLNNLHVQWQAKEFIDLVIMAKNKALTAHGCVVSAFSPTVAVLISKLRKKSPAKSTSFYTIKVPFSHTVMETILLALYTGVFQPPVHIIVDILAAVKWLNIPELVSAIQNYMEDANLPLPELGYEESDLRKQKFDPSDSPLNPSNLAQFSVLEEVDNEHLISLSSSHRFPVTKAEAELARRSERKRKPNITKYGKDMIVKIPKLDFSNPDSILKLEVDSSCVVNFGDYLNMSLEKKGEGVGKDSEVNGSLVESEKEEDSSRAQSSTKQKRKYSKNRKKKIHTPLSAILSTSKKGSKPHKNLQVKVREKVLSSQRKRNKSKKKKKDSSVDGELVDSDKAKELHRTPTGTQNAQVKASDISTVIEEIDCNDPVKKELDLIFGNIEPIKCKKCFEKFSDVEAYNKHINNHPEYKCPECDIVFYRKFNFTRHMRDLHTGRAHLKCLHCGLVAKNETDLRKHAVSEHNDKKPFVCPHDGCGYRSWKYSQITNHMPIHDEQKQFKCDNCDQAFAQHGGLVSHQRACYQLQEYLCDLCGQSFNLSQSMKAHRRTVHFGEKRFKCSVCPHSSSDHRNLRRHMRIHENSFPYSCPVCKQQFRHSNSLKSHVASKHKDLPEDFHLTISPVSETRNRLGGTSYKRILKNDHINTMTAGVVYEKDDKAQKGLSKIKREIPSPTQMYQSASLSGDFLIPPEETHFDGSNSNDLELVDNDHQIPPLSLNKSLDLTGDLVLSRSGEVRGPLINSDSVDNLKDYSSLLDKTCHGGLYSGLSDKTPTGGQTRTSVFAAFPSPGPAQLPSSSTSTLKVKSHISQSQVLVPSSKQWEHTEETLSKAHQDSTLSLDFRTQGSADCLLSFAQRKKRATSTQFYHHQPTPVSPSKIAQSHSVHRSPNQYITGEIERTPSVRTSHPVIISSEIGSDSETHCYTSSEQISKSRSDSLEPTLGLSHSQTENVQFPAPGPWMLDTTEGIISSTVPKPFTIIDFSKLNQICPEPAPSSALSLSAGSHFLRVCDPSRITPVSSKLSSVSEPLPSALSQVDPKTLKLPVKILTDSKETMCTSKNVSKNFLETSHKPSSSVSYQVIVIDCEERYESWEGNARAVDSLIFYFIESLKRL